MSTNNCFRRAAKVLGLGLTGLALSSCASVNTPRDNGPVDSPSSAVTFGDGPTYPSAQELSAASTDVILGKVLGDASREEDDGGIAGAPALTVRFIRVEVQRVLGTRQSPSAPRGEIVVSWTVEPNSEPPAVGQSAVWFVTRADSATYPGIDTQDSWYIPLSKNEGVWDVRGNDATPRGNQVKSLRVGEEAPAGSSSFHADLAQLQQVVREGMSG